MKKVCLLLLLSLAASARAENPPLHAPSQTDKPAPARETVQALAAPQENQKSTSRLKVDGILVQLVKTDNPLQLINPAAPGRYGSAEDNIVRDPASGKVSGLKFLQLRF